MRYLLPLLLLAGCSATTWPAPWEQPKNARTAQSERAVAVRAEYPDGRPVVAITLRVADSSEGVWYVGTDKNGVAPIQSAGLPLVSFSYRAKGDTEDTPFHALATARRHESLYVVTIPEEAK